MIDATFIKRGVHVLALIAVLLQSIGTSSSAQKRSNPAVRGTREAQLAAAVAAPDWMVRRRALQEIYQHGEVNESMCSTLVRRLSREPLEGEAYDLVRVLSACGTNGSAAITQALHQLDGERGMLMSCAAANTPDRPQSLTRFFLERSTNSGVSPVLRLTARVALTRMGQSVEENRHDLAASLKGPGRETERLLTAMLLTRPSDFASPEITSNLMLLVRGGGDTSGYASVLLACFGKSGSVALGEIRQVRSNLDARSSTGLFLLYTSSQAKLEAKEGAWLTRDNVRALGHFQDGFDHTAAAAWLAISAFLIDEREISHLPDLLRDTDKEVVSGALSLCWAVGVGAQGAQQEVLRLAENGETVDIRAAAALAMGAIGARNNEPKLAALLHGANEEPVRAALRSAIKLLALGQTAEH